MAENSTAGSVAKFGLGLGIGFGLYLLISNLRLGGGFGLGGGRGEGTGEGTAEPTPGPLPPPPLPHDEQPLLFVVEHPRGVGDFGKLADPASRARRDAVLYRLDLGTEEMSTDQMYRRMSAMLRSGTVSPTTLDEVVARIKAGGRDDVRLITTGNIRSGTWDDVTDALMAAGIKHWREWHEAPADRKPGDPPKRSKWNLFDKHDATDNPNSAGHYLFEQRGTAYWNLASPTGEDPAPRVSGNGRGQYGPGNGLSRCAVPISVGRGYYRGHG